MRRNQGRLFFCDACNAVTKARAIACSACGAAITDVDRLDTAT